MPSIIIRQFILGNFNRKQYRLKVGVKKW